MFPALRSFTAHLLQAALFPAALLTAQADPVLKIIFSDPEGALAQPTEETGAQSLPANFRGPNVAFSENGKAYPLAKKNPALGGLEQRVEMGNEPLMGGPFFRAVQSGTTFDFRNFCGVEVAPDFEGASLASLSSLRDGKLSLRGSIDFVFRIAEEPESGSAIQWKILDLSGKDSLRLVVATDRSGHGLKASLIRQDAKYFDTDLDGTGDATQVTVSPAETGIPVESGKTYHAAITFATDEKGETILRLFLKPGIGSIDTTKPGDLNAESHFGIVNSNNVLQTALPSGSVILGTFAPAGKASMTFTMDLAVFRIFTAVPDILPGLGGP